MAFRSYLKHRAFRHSTGGVSYTPKQIANLYGVPPSSNGAGRSIAVIELGGGLNQAALDTYFKSLGLSVKPVIVHSVDGAVNSPGDPMGADGEVMLDLCIAGGIAPAAQLHAFFAPNTNDGFLHAIQAAHAALKAGDAISISWGGPEDSWDASSLHAFDAEFQACLAAGILVTVAAGDNGSSDGESSGQHVDFPASSPHVLACGGTTLVSTPTVNETVWNDGSSGGATGGGISTTFALPAFQSASGVPGGKMRGVPDVAGDADPETGWAIVNTDGKDYVFGGTSAVAPLWAAIYVVLTQALGKATNLLTDVYTAKGWNRDITSGNNGTYVAKAGWDACTGNGTPNVAKLLNALAVPVPAPTPTPTPTPSPAPSPTPTPTATTKTIVVSGTNLSVLVNGKPV